MNKHLICLIAVLAFAANDLLATEYVTTGPLTNFGCYTNIRAYVTNGPWVWNSPVGQETEWLGSPITGEAFGGGPAKGWIDQRQKGNILLGLQDGGSVVWKNRRAIENPPPQIVLLRSYIQTNHIPQMITSGTPDCPDCAVAWIHPAHDEVVTNYVLGFWQGTNTIELLTATKK